MESYFDLLQEYILFGAEVISEVFFNMFQNHCMVLAENTSKVTDLEFMLKDFIFYF